MLPMYRHGQALWVEQQDFPKLMAEIHKQVDSGMRVSDKTHWWGPVIKTYRHPLRPRKTGRSIAHTKSWKRWRRFLRTLKIRREEPV